MEERGLFIGGHELSSLFIKCCQSNDDADPTKTVFLLVPFGFITGGIRIIVDDSERGSGDTATGGAPSESEVAETTALTT
jgi:hypothetical protein